MAGSCLACKKTFKGIAAHGVHCPQIRKCYICGIPVPKERFGQHIALHAGCYKIYKTPPHTPPATPLATLSCPTCQRRFTRPGFYRKHVARCTVNMAPPLTAPATIEIIDVDPDTIE